MTEAFAVDRSAEGTLDPIDGVLSVLDRGSVTGTNKFALLLALIDLAPTVSDESRIDVSAVAHKLLELHWDHARDFGGGVLRQLTPSNRKNTTAVLEVQRLRSLLVRKDQGERTFEAAQQLIDSHEWEASVRRLATDTKRNPLRKLQTIDGVVVPFLYEWPVGNDLAFLPGAREALIRFGPILKELVQFRYVRFIVTANQIGSAKSIEAQVEEHLFGTDRRMPPPRMLHELWQLQGQKCLYTHQELPDPLRGGCSVDHALAWSRVRLSSIENLVLTNGSVNSKKSNLLLGSAALERWVSHVSSHSNDLKAIASTHEWPTGITRVVTAWISVYQHAMAGSVLWQGDDTVGSLNPTTRSEILARLVHLRDMSR